MRRAEPAAVRQIVIGKVIASLRKQAQISQEDFAAAIGVSQPTLSRIERGQGVPNMVQSAHMARVLGMSTEELNRCVEESLRRTHEAAAGATHQAAEGGSVWTTALKVAGLVGLAGLAAFAVAAVVNDLAEDEDEDNRDDA